MFDSFDPLSFSSLANTDVAAAAMKRQILNILNSYVGWYDPFCELIQNSLDSVEEKSQTSDETYIPTISIVIDTKENLLVVSDNGTGLNKKKFQQFLAPCFSFKSGNTRGHKGVGATYLAYGFNYIQISTKTADYSVTGKMIDARKWLTDENPSGNPEITHDTSSVLDSRFNDFETGVSITLKFDSTTHPKSLSWLKAEKADIWKKILLIKTGLGSFFSCPNIQVYLKVISSQGEESNEDFKGIEYLWPYQVVNKSVKYTELKQKIDQLFSSQGPAFKVPSNFKNIECIYDTFDKDTLLSLLSLSDEEKSAINKLDPVFHFSYMYSAKVWSKFNENLNIRQNHSILVPGIQICANKMPQGEIIQIPLKRDIGRQFQVSIVAHFNNCSPDMGRKGFQTEVVDLSKSIAKEIIQNLVAKYKKYFRVSTGISPDLKRENEVDQWKIEIAEHEKSNPIRLINQHFFQPMNSISITSEPTREQDVISLFNQLIAGGVIRGIKIMSTNERFVYDGMFKVSFDEPSDMHIYDKEENPLGVTDEYVSEHKGFISHPKILEYKYSLDGLIENLQDGSKNSNEINLVVVWETGEDYQENYSITSLLNEDNLAERQYHGVTHLMTNLSTHQKEMDLIVLKELISYLNDPDLETKNQIEKYE